MYVLMTYIPDLGAEDWSLIVCLLYSISVDFVN